MKKFLATLFLLVAAHFFSSAQVISTFAGDGIESFTGDGGPAIDAGIHLPISMVGDTSGNFYFTDTYNNRIRKIDAAGIITTIAGSDTFGFSGDGGPAITARIHEPMGITLDKEGNIYFVDGQNERIRRIDAVTAIITTVAGNGTYGFNGDSLLADSAELMDPQDVAVDKNNNVYFTDESNSRIRKVAPSGMMTTICGNDSAGDSGDGGLAIDALIDGPYGILIDDTGNIYFSDAGVSVVRKIDTAGIITRVAGGASYGYSGDGGPATEAKMNLPEELAIDHAGNIYIADLINNRIRKVNAAGIISTVAGTGSTSYNGDGELATEANLRNPTGVFCDKNGNLYIVDFGNARIRFIASSLGVAPVIPLAQDISIYPNPNYGTFNLNITGNSNEPAGIAITNILGQIVYESTATTSKPITISLSQPAGIYLLSATTSHGAQYQQITVKK